MKPLHTLTVSALLVFHLQTAGQQVATIADLRAMVDPVNLTPTDTETLYSVEGIVTTPINLTTASHGKFSLQDATAGIDIYHRGAAGQVPPLGAQVRVIAPLDHYNGLLELVPVAGEPTHAVEVLSTGNAVPQPLELDFGLLADPPAFDRLEGSLAVARQVTISPTGTFPNSGNLTMTDSQGRTMTLRIDSRTDFGGHLVPELAVDVVGVIAQYDTSDPRTEGYQLLPSAFADVAGANEQPDYVAISGQIVSVDGADFGWVVFDPRTGDILTVNPDNSEVPDGAITVEHDGYLFPGLIDAHNHCHWNTVPMWRPGRRYQNRYEWQGDPAYDAAVRSEYHSLNPDGLWEESEAYGEIRALIGGTTIIQGSDGADGGYLLRNLDLDHWGAYSSTKNVTEFTEAEVGWLLPMLENGAIRRAFVHVGEGRHDDARAAQEFPFLAGSDIPLSGFVIIHGITLTAEDFDTMAQEGMYLVWSPKSNDVLYGETADVVAALAAGVTVALGPDWTISGSDNLLEELKFARQYSVEHLNNALTPTQLFRMATVDAAEVAGVDEPGKERLGRIAAGCQADLFLAPQLDPDPHVSLLLTEPQDIQLVFVDGKALYGDTDILERFVETEALDSITVRGQPKALHLINLQTNPVHEQRFEEITGLLESTLSELAPLIEDDPPAITSITCTEDVVTVTWSYGGILEWASVLAGPATQWTSTGVSDGLHAMPVEEAQRFYRVRRQETE